MQSALHGAPVQVSQDLDRNMIGQCLENAKTSSLHVKNQPETNRSGRL